MDEFIEYGWDDEISDEGKDFVLLPEGDYDFTVSKFERARHPGSEKVPPCNMAKVTVTIWGADDKIEITENFFLCNKFEWKMSQFFLAIGLKKHGETLKMNWNAVTGKKGKCHVFVDTYTKKDGAEGKSNKIKKYYDYSEDVATVKPNIQQNAQPAYNNQPTNYAHPAQNNGGGWKPGTF